MGGGQAFVLGVAQDMVLMNLGLQLEPRGTEKWHIHAHTVLVRLCMAVTDM